MDLPSLSYRGLRSVLIETFQYLHSIYRTDNSTVLLLALTHNGVVSTQGHSLKLHNRGFQTSLRSNVLGLRIVNFWNSMPSVNSFKGHFDKHYAHVRYCIVLYCLRVLCEKIDLQVYRPTWIETWWWWWWWNYFFERLPINSWIVNSRMCSSVIIRCKEFTLFNGWFNHDCCSKHSWSRQVYRHCRRDLSLWPSLSKAAVLLLWVISQFHWLQSQANSVGIEPEQFLVVFRPGTTSVRSGLGTFFVPEQEHVNHFFCS